MLSLKILAVRKFWGDIRRCGGYCHHGSFRLGPDGHPGADGHRRRQQGDAVEHVIFRLFSFFLRDVSPKGAKGRGKNHLPAKRTINWFYGSLPSCFFSSRWFFLQVLFGIYIAANPMIDALSWKGDLLRSFTSFTGRLDGGRLVAPLSPVRYPAWKPTVKAHENG